MMDHPRICCPDLFDRIMSAEEAAALIPPGVNVGMSGFTGAGYPKAVPRALATRIMDANFAGQHFKVGMWTGASTAPELDGALAMVGGIDLRLPYQSDPVTRSRINAGKQTPHLLEEAFSWHTRYQRTGTMQSGEIIAQTKKLS
jgi:succinyl-CoA:acetate CoA-transferase